MTRGAQRFHDFMSRAFTPVRHVPDEHVEGACGRVLDDLRDGVGVGSTHIGEDLLSASPQGTWLRPATVFATLAVAAAIGTAIVWSRGDTPLYRVVDGTVQADDTIRTNGGGAQLTLVDGSRVEMRSQSELSLERADDGLRIRLNKGGIIVHAAKQRTGHLYVQTKDVTVSVVGTVFLVDADEDGSSVAVIEGEVRVQQGAAERTLMPGEQVTTSLTLKAPPMNDAIGWSRNALALIALLQQSAVAPPALSPQNSTEPREAFEAVSIRTRPGGAASVGGRGAPSTGDGPCTRGLRSLQIDPRRFAITNAGFYTLITLAYGLGTDPVLAVNCRSAVELGHLSGGPEWIRSDTFDVEAVLPEGPPDVGTASVATDSYEIRPRLQRMLQGLLAERFKLSLRHERKEMPGYVLTVVEGGPKLTPWKEGDAISISSTFGTYEGVRNFPPFKHDYGDALVGHISGSKISMSGLASRLERITKRPVLDRTGVTGEFRFEIFFAPGEFYTPRESDRGRSLLPKPSLFAVLEEELGLKLEATKGRVEVLTIERVERPSEN